MKVPRDAVRARWNAFYKSLKVHPPDRGVSADAPPEERLRGRVKALLRRVTGANSKEFLIVLRELASPTGLLAEVIRKDLPPLPEKMEGSFVNSSARMLPEPKFGSAQQSPYVNALFRCS